jgi:hypothetical protein
MFKVKLINGNWACMLARVILHNEVFQKFDKFG